MTKRVVAPLFFFVLVSPAAAQDMPLSLFLKSGESWQPINAGAGKPSVPNTRPRSDVPGESATATTPDGGTLYVGSSQGRYVWAYRLVDGKPAGGDRYARLWVRRDQKDQPVTSLTFDVRGCLFAATPDGVQVFDPTGRLCGVIPLPAQGRPTHLEWDGPSNDLLTLWVGDAKYGRKLITSGAR